MIDKELQTALKNILNDICVECNDEFDRNFEREAFFSQKWARRKTPSDKDRGLLVSSGSLRRSIMGKVSGASVVFRTDLPYAQIHNEGGEIKVTARLKSHFWKKYYEAAGALGGRKRKDGSLRKDRKTVRLSAQAEFYKAMALKKAGSVIKIPRRQFLGAAPELEKAVDSIINDEMQKFFDKLDLIENR